jgi:phage major head subunit gpT-like protein
MPLDTAKATVTLRTLTQKFDNRIGTATPFYPQVSTIVPSDGADEAYGMLGNHPGVREWLGDRQFHELRAGTFTIANKHWENSLKIKKTDIADDRMNMYGPLMEDLAVEASYHPDELFFTTLVNGESTACFDGQFFFDTDHSWGDSGSQSNDLTSAAATGTTPTVAEAKAAFNTARNAMMKFKNDQGKLLNRPISMGLSNLLLLCNVDFEAIFKEALLAPLVSTGGTNVVVDAPQIMSSAYLTDTSKFYLFNLDGPLKPFVFQAREPLSRQMKGLDDSETKDVKFMTEARYNLGYLAWWKAVLHTFT